MTENTGAAPSVSIHKAALQGYLVFLLGVLLVSKNALSALTTGISLNGISGIVLGLFGIGGGAFGYFRPERFSHGAEPAPLYLYIIAGTASVAFGLWILSVAL